MSLTPIRAIAALNNSGVSCFQSGDLDSSLGLFRQALEAVATSLLPEELLAADRLASSAGASSLTSPEKDDDRRFAGAAASSSSVKRSRDASVLLVASANPSDGAGSVPQVTNAYTRPIHLIPQDGAYSPDPLVNAAMMSSILLFNVAVVFHVKGCGDTSRESSERTYLERARDLYRKAHGLIQPGAPLPPGQHQHPVLDVLSMALYNNIAAASYALGDYDACRTHVELLVSSCSSVMSDAHRRLLDPEAVSVLEWHTHLFMYNAYFLRTPPTVASAA